MIVITFWWIILVFSVIKPFVNKPVAKLYPAEISSAFTATWMMGSVIVTLPFIPIFNLVDWDVIREYYPRLGLSVFKGILLWYLVKFMQVINKESTSSSVFFTFIAFALGSTVNNLIFKEGLPLAHLLAFMSFGLLAIFFRKFGDMNTLSQKAAQAFWLSILIMAFFQCADHLVVKTIGWYPHLAISSSVMFGCTFFSMKKYPFRLTEMFTNKYMFVPGLVYVIAEYVLLYAFGHVMAVSYGNLALRMATPVVMLISAFLYKEKTPLNQALFGIAAVLLASVILFT